MTIQQIEDKIKFLDKLESLLLVILEKKSVDTSILASKINNTPEEIDKLILYLFNFSSEKLLEDLNLKRLNNYTLDDSKAIMRVFKAYISEAKIGSVELGEHFFKTVSYLLYAIRIEKRQYQGDLIIAQVAEENKQRREYYQKIEKEKMDEFTEQQKRQRAEEEKLMNQFYVENEELINKFINISTRKVSILNEYGYEDYEALYKEIAEVIKILLLKGKYSIGSTKNYVKTYIETSDNNVFPYPFDKLAKYLEELFMSKYSKQDYSDFSDIYKLNGYEFEGFLMNKFKSYGIDDVRGTSITGDQGADILLYKRDKVIAIQVKHHQNPVGNKAIQEIAGSLKYYNANVGAVITSGVFTKSAKALAQKNKILLIDKYNITDLPTLFTVDN